MDSNKVSQLRYEFENFINSIDGIRSNKNNLATCVLKPPSVKDQIETLHDKYLDEEVEYKEDLSNGLVACIGKVKKDKFCKKFLPWWTLDTSIKKEGKEFAVKDIRSLQPEMCYGIVIVHLNNVSFSKLGNSLKVLPGSPIRIDALRNPKEQKQIAAFGRMFKGVLELHIIHHANTADVVEKIKTLLSPSPNVKVKVREFENVADVSIEGCDLFDEISSPVVKDWIAIKKILNPAEEFRSGPHAVIQAVEEEAFEGDVIIWKEENRTMYTYENVEDEYDVKFLFSDVKMADRLQEAAGGAWFRRAQGDAPTVIERVKVVMAGQNRLDDLRIIHSESARNSPFVTQFQGIAVKLKETKRHLTGLPMLRLE